jgi:hypothetical protein
VAVHHVAQATKRRSTRLDQAVPVTVHGSDAFRAPYLERVSTLAVNCHGCRYHSKYDVLQGSTVFLEVNQQDENHTIGTCRARVKSILRLMTKERPFEVALELETPGNVWGVAPSPEDWFPVQEISIAEPEEPLAVQRPLARAESRPSLVSEQGLAKVSNRMGSEAAGMLSPVLAQLVSGLGEQIQLMAAKSAALAIDQEKGRHLAEFRSQLQIEASRTLDSVLAATRDELRHKMQEELTQVRDEVTRTAQERWSKKVEKDLAVIAERVAVQNAGLSERVEGMTAIAVERLQTSIEDAQINAASQFMAGVQDQLAPLMEEVETTVRKVSASEKELKGISLAAAQQLQVFLQQAMRKAAIEVKGKLSGCEKDFESNLNTKVAKANEDLEKRSGAVVDESVETLRRLSQSCEKAVHSYLQTQASSVVDQIVKSVREKTADISQQLAGEIEAQTRRYFESIGAVLAEVPKKTMKHSGD